MKSKAILDDIIPYTPMKVDLAIYGYIGIIGVLLYLVIEIGLVLINRNN